MRIYALEEARAIAKAIVGVPVVIEGDAVVNPSALDELEAEVILNDRLLGIVPAHHFAPGLYLRQITAPPGSLLTARIHRRDHLTCFAVGELTEWSSDDEERFIVGPCVLPSRARTRRVVYTHSETVWICIHAALPEPELEGMDASLVYDSKNPFVGKEGD